MLLYVMFGLRHELAVDCRLSVGRSSVMLLHQRQKLELCGNISAPPDSLGTPTVCVKIVGKNSKRFYGIMQVEYKGI